MAPSKAKVSATERKQAADRFQARKDNEKQKAQEPQRESSLLETMWAKKRGRKGSDNPEEEMTCCHKILSRSQITHWGLVIVVMIYTAIGGAIFQAIESPEEDKRMAAEEALFKNTSLTYATKIQNLYDSSATCQPENNTVIQQLLAEYLTSTTGISYSGDKAQQQKWSLLGSMSYAFTLFTTVGFGNIAPVTDEGKAASMFYALIGIPLMLATLSELGTLLSKMIKFCVRHARKLFRCCPSMPWSNRTILCKKRKRPKPDNDELPLLISCLLFAGWIALCALITSYDHGLTGDDSFFNSCYFYFITLTTIGLGDIVPETHTYLFVLFPVIFVGMSLISVIFNGVQTKINRLKAEAQDEIADALGWSEDTSEEEERMKSQEKAPATSMGIFGAGAPNKTGHKKSKY